MADTWNYPKILGEVMHKKLHDTLCLLKIGSSTTTKSIEFYEYYLAFTYI